MRQWMVGWVETMSNLWPLSSLTNSMIGMVARSAVDRPMNSLSVELSAISVWSCDAHRIGQPAYRMM